MNWLLKLRQWWWLYRLDYWLERDRYLVASDQWRLRMLKEHFGKTCPRYAIQIELNNP